MNFTGLLQPDTENIVAVPLVLPLSARTALRKSLHDYFDLKEREVVFFLCRIVSIGGQFM